MSNDLPASEARWPRLLSLAVHEFRTPVTVVAGYIRMLLKDRAGPLNEQQRRLLDEAEKSCGRLSGLIAEMSDLANLEAGTAPFNRSALDLSALVIATAASLPPLPDRAVALTVSSTAEGATVQADPTRLRMAFAALFTALRREVVTSSELLARLRRETEHGRPVLWVSIADEEHIEGVDRSNGPALGLFDEWRGGSGLSLAIARRIVNAHGGQLWSPAHDPKAGAIVVLPEG